MEKAGAVTKKNDILKAAGAVNRALSDLSTSQKLIVLNFAREACLEAEQAASAPARNVEALNPIPEV